MYFKPHLSGERKEWFWLSENFCVKIKAYFQVIRFHVFSKRDKPSLVLIHLFCCCKVLFNCFKKKCILKSVQELPCWLSGKESACQCRRHEFSPWSGKIPHPAEQLSLCLGAQEPQLLSPRATLPKPLCLRAMLCNKESHRSEMPHSSSLALLSTTREKPVQQWRPSTNKEKKKSIQPHVFRQ